MSNRPGPVHDRCSDAPPPLLLEGVALFNRGEFFECHEILETLWRAESDPVRYLYQGILQIGVAFHHLRRANWIGAIRQLERGLAKLERYPATCQGVDVALLAQQAECCLRLLRQLGPERVGEFDWALVPRVKLVGGSLAGSDTPVGDRVLEHGAEE
ncbi:DUF309 domain-containing protein [Thermomicrobiaceae bacterium CFH 74404]|uniref:DUF309 domain-containing protein n=1 Tax=Thermalbibacter longus TaxID=2951981 RepID=A0AA42BC44_9BACT|nr:DUF309 domain-containing protein [Thermalbibacter longus]MCM8748398.1 DUF309 domain-containing protein [Thermalbibacter longus]